MSYVLGRLRLRSCPNSKTSAIERVPAVEIASRTPRPDFRVEFETLDRASFSRSQIPYLLLRSCRFQSSAALGSLQVHVLARR
jgi:hypothetical protein